MSLWSIMAAPLIASTDLRTIGHDSQEILLNSLVLSINQDQLGRLGLEIQRVSMVGSCVRFVKSTNLLIFFHFKIVHSGAFRILILKFYLQSNAGKGTLSWYSWRLTVIQI